MFSEPTVQNPNNIIVKDILTANNKTANIFEKYGIDFC